MQLYTKLWAPQVGFSAYVVAKSKSGDALTFLGNTMFLMATLASVFILKNKFCMFTGDDTLFLAVVSDV